MFNQVDTFIKSCEGDIILTSTEKLLNVKSPTMKCSFSNNMNTYFEENIYTIDPQITFNLSNKSINNCEFNIDLSMFKSILDESHIIEE